MSYTMVDGELRALSHHQLSAANLAASVALTATTSAESPTAVMFQNTGTTNIRWLDTGDSVTAATGFVLEAKGMFLYTGALTNLRFILESGSPLLEFTYYTRRELK